MKKKLFVCLIAVSIAISGCGRSQETQDISESVPASSEEKTVSEQDDSSDSETMPDLSIEEQVIFDQDEIKITATGIDSEGSFMGSNLNLLIENNSDKNITVQARNVSVNGYMVDTSMSADVASQKKSNDSLTLSDSSLNECGIERIANLEFSFHIFDSETWDTIIDSEMMDIKTSYADIYTQSYDDSGDLIYEDGSVRIISKGMTNDSIFGPGWKLYIENKLDQNITIQTRDTSIDDFMIDAIFSAEIAGKKRIIDSMTFMSSDLEENDLSDFHNIETSFHIFYTDGFDTVIDTEPLMIDL